MVTTKLNLSMTEPQVRQIYAKQGDTGRVLDISLDQTPEDGTLRILRPDGVEVTSEAVTGGEVESGSTFESLTEADVTELTVGIEPVQDLHGYDHPWVGGAGKNLLDASIAEIGIAWNGTSNTARARLVIPCKPSTQYTLSINGTNNLESIYSNDGASVPLSSAGASFTNTKTFTTTSTSNYIVVGFNKTGITQADIDALKLQLELGSTATAWQPYSNICPITGHDEVTVYFGAEQGTADETYTTSLGQTVYGGSLDMVSGVLTVDRVMVDLGSLTWLLNSSLNGKPAFYVRLYDAKTVSTSSVADMTTSCYSVISADNLYIQKDNTGIIALNGQNYLQVRDTRYSTASAYKSGITGQTLVYELATPLTYTLTTQQIKTLVGTNNVWASSGDIVNVTFTYGGLLSELPSEATEIVGKCYCDVEQNGVSSMPFTLNVKKNERES